MLCFVFAALVVLLDQLFKRWIVMALETGGSAGLIPGLIGLTHVRNTGAAFSILEGKRWLLVVVMFICVIIIISILLRYNEGFWGTLGLSAVLGGAVGNLIDRTVLGYVVDMFEFQFIDFAIFNIADIFITLGGLTFIIFFIVSTIKSGKGEESLSARLDDGYVDEQECPETDAEPEYEYIENYDELFTNDNYHGQQTESAYENDSPEPVYPDVYPDATSDNNHGSIPSEYLYEEPATSDSSEFPPDSTPTLAALDELESELTEFEDYDVDTILREYGFEDNND